MRSSPACHTLVDPGMAKLGCQLIGPGTELQAHLFLEVSKITDK